MMPRALLYAIGRDRRGAVAPMAAVLGTLLVGAAGLSLDVGLYYVDGRALQNATEAAALSAAGDHGMTTARATANALVYLQKNGFDAAVLQSVTVGCYSADGRTGVGAASRFTSCASGAKSTAVRIVTKKRSRQFLSRLFGAVSAAREATATATAARVDEAGIGITTGVVAVNTGLVSSVNDLLGGLLGIKLYLSAPQIGTLMSGSIDAGRFFDALAARVGETGTYSDLTSRTVPLADILQAGATAATANGDSAGAAIFSSLAGQVGTGYTVPLKDLFGLGVWSHMPVGEADEQPGLRAGLNAYQLLAFAIQAGSGKIDASDAISRVVSGSTLTLAAVATGPIDRPRFAFGPEGDTRVGTAALRIQLQLGLGNVSILGQAIAVNSVPLLIDVAAGSATLSSIACGEEAAIDTIAQVQTNSGLINAYIGTAPANVMTSPMPPLSAASIGDVTLVNVTILGTGVSATARAVAQPVLGTNRLLSFGPGGDGTIGRPPAAGNAASIGNGSQAGPLLTSLNGNLAVTAKTCVLGTCANALSLQGSLLSSITTPVAAIVSNTTDPLIDNLLAALGIQLGNATVWVTGARCGVPVLV